MKKLILFVVAIFLCFSVCGCRGDKPAILFYNEPVTEQNVMNYSSEFSPNQRIYYLILLPKTVQTNAIEIQLIKKDNKDERLGYNLAWSKTARLYEDQMYYFNDYLVVSETGAYVMKVYSKDNPTKTLCMAQFFVRSY